MAEGERQTELRRQGGRVSLERPRGGGLELGLGRGLELRRGCGLGRGGGLELGEWPLRAQRPPRIANARRDILGAEQIGAVHPAGIGRLGPKAELGRCYEFNHDKGLFKEFK